MNLLIKNGRVIDPAAGKDGIFDILIRNGTIVRIGKGFKPEKNSHILSAKDQWVMPGFIDVHVHLREPGGEKSETIESGTRAAAAGGITSVLAMANTNPVADTPENIRFILEWAKKTAQVRVYPVGAITQGLQGQKLTDMPAMARAGCRAFSDDGHCVMNSSILRQALEMAKKTGVVLIEHCEDENLSHHGVMNEGGPANRLKYRGIPAESETIMVARNVYLAKLTGAPIHCAHTSTADAVELIRRAKKQGIPISAETCPHYFTLTDEAVQKYGTHAKMKPPLRTAKDVQAVRKGLKDGTIDVIATDHAPHFPESKAKPFAEAPFGIIGLETSFVLVYNELILKKILSPLDAVKKMSANPAKIFGLPGGSLSAGSLADITIFDPRIEWIYTQDQIVSKSKNSPFTGRKFKGRITTTIVGGKIIYRWRKV